MAIPLKRFARPLLGFLSESEMRALLQAIDNSWSGRRDHLLFLFLYNTGARVSEALSVRVQTASRSIELSSLIMQRQEALQRRPYPMPIEADRA
jgi:site-specific recombinase XerD